MSKLLGVLFFISAMLLNFNVNAEPALSKKLIQQYSTATEQLEVLMQNTPDIEKKLTAAMMKDKNEVLSLIKSLGVYPKFQQQVVSAGFSDVEQYLDTSLRLVGAVFRAQMKNMPKGMSIDSHIQQMKTQIANMKKQGLPPEALSQMEATVTQQMNTIELMQRIAKNATEADVKFVSDNLAWVMQAMPKGIN